ncbi:MAG: hypothetical protein CYG59_09180 [Chloroflexi bacterium]|nr:MAG: hypothetical protein CYG59_09180 [Chloroflexota bacterium]
MPVFETFSKRQKKRAQAGQPDVYQYDDLPTPFRVQVVHIWRSINEQLDGPRMTLSAAREERSRPLWEFVANTLARELGVHVLADSRLTPFQQVSFFLEETDSSRALDLIDLAFNVLDVDVREQYAQHLEEETLDDAIEELNHRFREHGIGYQFTGGELIKVDSQFVHAEIVTPAISLLHDLAFRGPEDEFLRAHEHYRHGRNKEAITEALKAFESALKAICEARGWSYDKTATASKLIATVFDHGLIRPDMASYFAGFRSALESGLPTLRNKSSGHGQGAHPVSIPDHYAAFALHLAASNIVLLVEAHKALP